MPNVYNVGSIHFIILDGFVPQQGYMVNPNIMRQNPQTYPNGYVQGFNGFQNQNNQQFRRQQ